MRTTTSQDRVATPNRRSEGGPDHEPIIAVSPALGPIPAIAFTTGSLPAADLRHAIARALMSLRAALSHAHRPAH